MPKTLVVGCDGTWNDLDSETNINWLTSEAVQDDHQLVYYDKDVGTAGDESIQNRGVLMELG